MTEFVRVACERTDGLRWERRRLFPTRDEIIWDPNLPADSAARTLRFRFGHLLIRPYSPQGFIDISCVDDVTRKLYVEKNEKWPKVYGWPLAITTADQENFPLIVPGKCMLIFKRLSDDLMGEDQPQSVRFLGHILPVMMTHLSNLDSVITPSPVPQEY